MPDLISPRPTRRTVWRRWAANEWLWAAGLTLAALVIRLPYQLTIPPAGDEPNQIIYAQRIALGQITPWVGNDAYAGPFFFYLLALLLRLGFRDPMLGSFIVLGSGVLTVPLTYVMAKYMLRHKGLSLVAAGLVATNPYLVLLNSHQGGTTFLLPFFVVLFLVCVLKAVESGGGGWLLLSGLMGGLALQVNPFGIFPVASGWLWAAFKSRQTQRLRQRWPLWPFLAGLVIIAVFSPVIIYNITSRLNSVAVLGERSYLWESHPTVFTFLNNERRMLLQLVRQTAGVMVAEETLRALVGWPLLYALWLSAGMAYAIRQRLWLLVMLVAPVVLIVPILSAHYGDLFAARFTTFLTPILAISMGGVLSGVGLQFFSMAWMTRLWRGAKTGLVVLAVSFPLVPLFQYYAQVEAYQQSGWPWLELSREMVDANQGERVYISDSGLQQQIRGIPFVPQAYLILGDIRHDLLPLNQIIGQLYAAPGPALLMLSPADVAVLSQIGTLAPWPGAANAQALTRGFGLYRLDANVSLIKPEYVIDEAAFHARPPAAPLHLQVGDSLELMGYDFPQHASPGQTLELAFYWRKTGPLPSGPYMGFIHLLNVSTSTLVAQVDHLLGGDRYPVEAWQPNEIVVDRYVLALGTEALLGALEIRTGVYVWPDLTRLSAPGFPDNVITLKSIAITP